MFQGPSGGLGSSLRDRYSRILQIAQDYRDGYATGRPTARYDSSAVADQDAIDADRERLLMTPGVSRGGRTFAPLEAPQRRPVLFERHGETYSYSPEAAAQQQGESQATAEEAANRARFENLRRMPGFTEREASRIVYGRGQAMDSDQARRALAQYVRSPSREAAATAIEEGASPYSVPFTGAFDPAGERARPGTEAYIDMQMEQFRQQEAVREERARREAELRAALRPAAKPRTYEYVGKDNLKHVINLDTGDEISVSPSEVRSTRKSGPDNYMSNAPTAGSSAPTSTPPVPTPPPPVPSAPNAPGLGSLRSIQDSAYAKLVKDGIDDPTPQQLRDAMNHISLARQQMRAGRPERP